MGCDIHAHIEYKEHDRWEHFANPYFGRDYNAFELMAGVRGDNKLFEPRGVPKDCSWATVRDFTLWISTTEKREGVVTPERATQYRNHGDSEVWDTNRITNPDWHTPSWLNAAELTQVVNSLHYPKPTLDAIIAAMKALDSNPENTRLVFWFDN